MASFERVLLYAFVSLRLVQEGDKDFIPAFFVFQEPLKEYSHKFCRNVPHVIAYKLFGFGALKGHLPN